MLSISANMMVCWAPACLVHIHFRNFFFQLGLACFCWPNFDICSLVLSVSCQDHWPKVYMKLCHYFVLSPQACLSIGANLQQWPLFVSLRSHYIYCVLHMVRYYTDFFCWFFFNQFEFGFMFLSTLITLLILRGRKEEKKYIFTTFELFL